MKAKNIIVFIKYISEILKIIKKHKSKNNIISYIRSRSEVDEILLNYLDNLNNSKEQKRAVRVFIVLLYSKNKHGIYKGKIEYSRMVKEHSYIEPLIQVCNFFTPANIDNKENGKKFLKDRHKIHSMSTYLFKTTYLRNVKDKFGVTDTLFTPICFFKHKIMVVVSTSLTEKHNEDDIKKSIQLQLELEKVFSKCKGFARWNC